MDKSREIKLKTKELLLTTTFHGIQNIIKGDSKFIKVMWLIFLIGSACYGIFLINESIMNYFEYEVVTSIRSFYEDKAQLPAISICSSTGNLNYSNVLSCFLNAKDCSNYFEIYDNFYLGRCLRFNGGKNIRNESVDVLNAYFVQISSGLSIDISITSFEDVNKLYLNFHNASLNPYILGKQHILYSGSQTSFQIERIFDEKLEEPYNNCIKDPTRFKGNKSIINYLKKMNRDYTKYECVFYFIFLKSTENSECDCRNAFDGFYCKNKTCESIFVSELINNNFYDSASNYCPIECNTIKYSFDVNSQSFPSSGTINSSLYYPHLFRNFENLQNKLFRIKMYYEDLKYTYIKQKPKYEVVDVISNIGGTLGLFLGISFLSFVEIFELFIEIFFILAKN